MARRTGRAIRLLALLLIVPAITAQQAVVCPTFPTNYYSWGVQRVNTGSLGASATPANDTSYTFGPSRNYFAVGTRLFAYENANGAQAWNFELGTTIQNFPSPVPLASGEFIFLTTEDGRLWKLDATNPASNVWVDTRRSLSGTVPPVNTFVLDPVCATDKQLATPAVQLYAFANAAFKSQMDAIPGHAGDDLVFVISRNTGCDPGGVNARKRNEIRAYYASNLGLKWVFNANTSNSSSPHEVDHANEGCAIWYGDGTDPAQNTLYCGTNLVEDPAEPGYSVAQQSLWALDTMTGAVRWSYRAGSIQNRPMPKLGPDGLRVYVVNFKGGIQAFSPTADPSDPPPSQGLPLWSTPLQVPLNVQAVPSPFIAGGKTHLLVVDFGGNIRDYRDDGANGFIGPAQHPTGIIATTNCQSTSLCYRGEPVVGVGMSPSKIYLGRNDGRVQQLTDTFAREGVMNVVTAPAIGIDVAGVSVDVASVVTSTAVDRLVAVTETGFVTRINIPFCTNSPNPGGATACSCGASGVCGTGAVNDPFRCCDPAQDSCNSLTANNPCRPWRCSTRPSCCLFFGEFCASDADCGGRPGSCDLVQQFCTAPCDPSVNPNCAGPSNTCQVYTRGFDGGYQVPNNTACDDKQLCTAASPAPVLASCILAIGGTNCTRDRAGTDLVDNTGDCPQSAPICTGSGSAFGGQGGAIVGGLCSPEGTACNLATGKARGNFGSGASSNDVCRSGTCSSESYASCSCVNPGDRCCATGLACCGSAGCIDLSTNSSNCGTCGQVCPGGTSCVGGRCCPGGVCP
jgi:outer membrane protein assembly factor BamB